MDGSASTSASSNGELPKFKVVLLGEGAVGKSSMMLRYVENKFNPRHISTIQAAFLSKRVVASDGRQAELAIWDTAGQEKYHALGPIYYRGSHGAVLVYDITDERSFDKVKVWVKELRRALGDSTVLCIVGNKTDLEAQRVVSSETGEEYAKEVGAEYFEASAKTNQGIEDLFAQLTTSMLDHVLSGALSRNEMNGSLRRPRNAIRLVDDETPVAKKKCC